MSAYGRLARRFRGTGAAARAIGITGRAQPDLAATGLALAALGALLLARGAAPGSIPALGFGAMLLLAYANGANWGVLWMGIGAVAVAFVARALVATFGAGLLARGVGFGPEAALAVLLGALAWVLVATRTGLPVSTTHAITGAVVGVGLASAGAGGVAWDRVAQKIALPLLISPALAIARGLGASLLVRHWPGQTLVRALHWLSSGGTSLARALNDVPKIVAVGAGFAVGAGANAGERRCAGAPLARSPWRGW